MQPIIPRSPWFHRVILHSRLWLLYTAVVSSLNLFGRPVHYVFGYLMVCFLMALTFYALLVIHWHIRNNWLKAGGYLVVAVAMQLLLFELLNVWLPSIHIELQRPVKAMTLRSLFFGLNMFLDVALGAVAYALHRKAVNALEQQLYLERALHAKEVERLNMEALALQRELERRRAESAQWVTAMNSHGIRNAYNAIYQLLLKNEKIANGFLGLKAMHEYVLENAPGQSGMVPLRHEIEMLRIWSKVYELGYQSTSSLDIEVATRLPPILVPSFSYIVFLENAYEQGDNGNAEHPVQIRINIVKQHVHFRIRNKKITNKMKSRFKSGRPSGLGIKGVRQRLELTDIPYNLVIEDRDDFYTATLSIDYTKHI